MITRMLMASVLVIASVGCSHSIVTQSFEPDRVLHYSQMQGIEDLSRYAFFLSEGDKLPLVTSLHSDWAKLEEDRIHLKLKKPLYFRVEIPKAFKGRNNAGLSKTEHKQLLAQLQIYISSDGEQWAGYRDISAVKKVLGLSGGTLKFGMGTSKADGLLLYLNAAAIDNSQGQDH